MPTIGTAISCRSPQSQSGPLFTIRAESVLDSKILVINPFKELFYIVEVRNIKNVHMFVNDGFTFRALPGNIITEHESIIETRLG